jgi:hypothetical protein
VKIKPQESPTNEQTKTRRDRETSILKMISKNKSV